MLQIPNIEQAENLLVLLLRDNFLHEIPNHSIKRKGYIERLDLGDNNISALLGIFNGSMVVRDLSLDSNQLQTLNDNAFVGTKARRILLAMNRIENISDSAFLGLDDTLEYLDLERNSIKNFPNALKGLKKLKYLYLPHNLIREINESSLGELSNSLKALSFAGNRLKSVPYLALSKCTKLSHVNLGHNDIKEVTQVDFLGWGESIRTLLLQNNQLVRLESNLFLLTPNLKELSLSFNILTEVEPDAFVDLGGSLGSLDLSYSLYRDDFPEDFLQPLYSLAWLALDNNNMRVMSRSAISNLSQIKYINLESNQFTKLPLGFFNSSIHTHLREVRLSHNHINNLGTNSFKQLMSLQTVVLTGNNIIALDFRSFNELPNLTTVILSQNRINTLQPSCFVRLPYLRKLDMQLNDLREFSLNVFENVSSSSEMHLNISRNEIKTLTFDNHSTHIKIRTLDASHNRLSDIPTMFLQFFANSLTRLDLAYNMISQIQSMSFENLRYLEVVNLQHNGIRSVRRKAFADMKNLQILDLSHNHLKSLQDSQFSSCPTLRIVDLSSNHLRNFPKDVFHNTTIERLVLSNNEFIVFPGQALGGLGFTLRHLDLSHNHIDRLDSTLFHETQFLSLLNLCKNKITIIPDNAFTGLGNLLHLELCGNSITANFKELFHYVPKLRHLNLANTGLRVPPAFPLPQLAHLNLSGNYLDDITLGSTERLFNLRTLVLSGNRFTNIPSHCWSKTPLLRRLDISLNPIQVKTIFSQQFKFIRYCTRCYEHSRK